MTTVCSFNQCVGCMACVHVCNRQAITMADDYLWQNAQIDETKCIHCGKCRSVCLQQQAINANPPIDWKQGWTNDDDRKRSSSGGAAYAIMSAFLSEGGSVYSCACTDGDFNYRKVKGKEDLVHFVGSKYVKSNPGNIFKQIEEELKSGKKVLFIGLPCHVQAIKLVAETYADQLYTVDIICHGTPSQKLFQLYISEEKIDICKVDSFSFRKKAASESNHNERKASSETCFDYWLEPFLKGISYTENCYNCRFAQFERCSDVTIGDSWGSRLPKEQRKKGISLILCNTLKGKFLVEQSQLKLADVDIEIAKEANPQLNHPTPRPTERMAFEKNMVYGYTKALKKIYWKTIIKRKLLRSHLGKVYLSLRNTEIPHDNTVKYELTYSLKQSK